MGLRLLINLRTPEAELYQKQPSNLETVKIDNDTSRIRFKISKVCVVNMACHYYFHFNMDQIQHVDSRLLLVK